MATQCSFELNLSYESACFSPVFFDPARSGRLIDALSPRRRSAATPVLQSSRKAQSRQNSSQSTPSAKLSWTARRCSNGTRGPKAICATKPRTSNPRPNSEILSNIAKLHPNDIIGRQVRKRLIASNKQRKIKPKKQTGRRLPQPTREALRRR